MKPVLRVGMSISGSIVLSTLASWALRRLLWSVTDGGERGEQRRGPLLVIMPIFVGNTWVIGQPKQLATPQAQVATPRKHIFPRRRHQQWQLP
jgi:hypothetical protein